MKTLGLFVAILFLSLGVSALLNDPIYRLLGGTKPPHDLINTTAKLVAIPMVVWVVRYMGVGSWRAVGFNLPRGAFLLELAKGWFTGVVVMAALVALLLLSEARLARGIDARFWYDFARAAVHGLVGGLLLALLEETFIRGAMYSAMRREASLGVSVLLTSLFFGLFHFIDPQPVAQDFVPGWQGGVSLLAGAFSPFLHPLDLIDSLAALTIAGILLALLREHRGSLAFGIGMHAGWVFVIKITRSLTHDNGDSPWSWGIGAYDQVTGWISVAWLLLLITVWLGWRRYRERRGEVGA